MGGKIEQLHNVSINGQNKRNKQKVLQLSMLANKKNTVRNVHEQQKFRCIRIDSMSLKVETNASTAKSGSSSMITCRQVVPKVNSVFLPCENLLVVAIKQDLNKAEIKSVNNSQAISNSFNIDVANSKQEIKDSTDIDCSIKESVELNPALILQSNSDTNKKECVNVCCSQTR
jgi:hypothetical protein